MGLTRKKQRDQQTRILQSVTNSKHAVYVKHAIWLNRKTHKISIQHANCVDVVKLLSVCCRLYTIWLTGCPDKDCLVSSEHFDKSSKSVIQTNGYYRKNTRFINEHVALVSLYDVVATTAACAAFNAFSAVRPCCCRNALRSSVKEGSDAEATALVATELGSLGNGLDSMGAWWMVSSWGTSTSWSSMAHDFKAMGECQAFRLGMQKTKNKW